MATIATLKKQAAQAGLELYYDRQWRSWGLIDPQMRVESMWLSPGSLHALDRDTFETRFIAEMRERIARENST